MTADDLPHQRVALYTDASAADVRRARAASCRWPRTPAPRSACCRPARAEDSIEEKKLSPALAENVFELCNVLTSLLNRDGAPHVKLYQVCCPGDRAQRRRRAAARPRPPARPHVEIARYGGGRLSLSLAP